MDVITIPAPGGGTTLPSQLVAAYAVGNPFPGHLGLKAQTSSTTSFSDTHYSILGHLNATGDIPSAYYGYTAGLNQNTASGSLTLGGYDAARGNVDHVLTSDLALESDRDIQLVLTAIKIGDNEMSLARADYFIDSVVPEIWLPQDICNALQDKFGLLYEEIYGIYYVNDSQHDALQALAPTMTLALQAPGDAQNRTDITLSYNSFDQMPSYSLATLTAGSPPINNFPPSRLLPTAHSIILAAPSCKKRTLSLKCIRRARGLIPVISRLITIVELSTSLLPSFQKTLHAMTLPL